MKINSKVAVISMVLIAAVATSGCGKKEEKQEAPASATAPTAAPAATGQGDHLALVQFGPQPITAGKDFNVQPNGQSALWAKAENVTPSTVIMLNNIKMKSTPNKDGKLITCFVPKEMYATPGEYTIYLTDTKTGVKSNEQKLVVK